MILNDILGKTTTCVEVSKVTGRTEFQDKIDEYLKKGNSVKKFDSPNYSLSTRRIISSTEDRVKRAMNGSGYENVTSEVEFGSFNLPAPFNRYMSR